MNQRDRRGLVRSFYFARRASLERLTTGRLVGAGGRRPVHGAGRDRSRSDLLGKSRRRRAFGEGCARPGLVRRAISSRSVGRRRRRSRAWGIPRRVQIDVDPSGCVAPAWTLRDLSFRGVARARVGRLTRIHKRTRSFLVLLGCQGPRATYRDTVARAVDGTDSSARPRLFCYGS